jgi:hypothetical protein
MNIETIQDYQKWAQRGYVTALTCRVHGYHELLPMLTGDGIVLVCPRGDYKRTVGQAEYLSIKRKVLMAEALWRSQ